MTESEMAALGIQACAYRFATNDRVRVEWRDDDRWAIADTGCCLNTDGEWEYEPQPSSRNAEFIARCRFSLDVALRKAVEIARKGNR